MLMRRNGTMLARTAIAVALSSLLISATSWAQGFFYRETAKDDRIYVFAVAAEADRWEHSGETGRAITRLGYGPNGETVVFDSEAAINLYNYKHGKPGEAFKEERKPTMVVAWRDGKTTITTDNAQLQISNRIQVRWTDVMPDDSVQLGGTAARGDSKGSFRIRRAKFKLEGWFYKPELTYEVQLNWPDVTGSPASRFLEDANINWDLSKGKKALMVRFGQFKAPMGRQEMTSSGAQQFVDRSDVSGRYAPSRETGIALWGTLAGNTLEWRAGAFNGNGRSQTENDNARYLYVGRLTWQPTGAIPFGSWGSGALLSEGDFESLDKPLFALAANVAKNDKRNATTNIDTDDTTLSGDVIFKYKRFSTVAEYFNRRSKPETGASFDDRGWYLQAGYLLDRARRWEAAFRYGDIDPSDLKGGDNRKELGGALSYYYNKHNLKVQADYRQLEDKATSVKNKELRLQTQFIF